MEKESTSKSLLERIRLFFSREKEKDYPIRDLEEIIQAVEESNAANHRSWRDWKDASAVIEEYGLNYADMVTSRKEGAELIQKLIDTNGAHVKEELEALRMKNWGYDITEFPQYSKERSTSENENQVVDLRGVIKAIRKNSNFNNISWSDWKDASDVIEEYGLLDIIQRAIDTEGESLDKDLRIMETRVWREKHQLLKERCVIESKTHTINFRGLIDAVEGNNEFNYGSWRDWDDALTVLNTYGPNYFDYDISKQDALDIIQKAIDTDGASLNDDLRMMEKIIWGKNFSGSWWNREENMSIKSQIERVESHIAESTQRNEFVQKSNMATNMPSLPRMKA